MNICFIPARNSSTRLPMKNIKPFGKGNLVTNTIEQAIESNIFDRIILSSNDKNILDYAKQYDVETHLRDDSKDQIIGVIQQAIPELNVRDTDTIGLLLVTCPLRNIYDIKESYRIFKEIKFYHPVVSVKKNENPIQLSFKLDSKGHIEPVFPQAFYKSTRKQDHYDTYYYNDAIIFDTVKRWMNQGRTLYGDMPIPYLMPWERSIAIDYKFQLQMAQGLRKLNDD